MSDKKDKVAKSESLGDQNFLLISKALSDPRRLDVLRKIATSDQASCMDMRSCLAMNAATLSHHIKTLESAGLIETHRDGKLVRATIRRKTWKAYVGQLKQFTA